MRIGVDATCLANPRGYGRFARELLGALVAGAPDDEFVLFADAAAARCWSSPARNVRVVEVSQRVSPTVAAGVDGSRAMDDMLRLTRAVWRARVDVFFSPSVYTYFPLPPGLGAVVTLHDAIADRYPELTLPSRRARLFWNLKTRVALAQARVVLTVSDYAASEIVAVHGIPANRIRVAAEAPAAAYRPSDSADEIVSAVAPFGLDASHRWFVYVGGFNPHKHVDVVIRAHAKVCAGIDDPPHLLLVGARAGDVFHGAGDSISRALGESDAQSLVHWTGFVPDDALRHILSGALALLLPSQSEGFGLPAVEAAACGTPVIATTASPLPQLLEGGGVFIAPGNEDDLVIAMRAMMSDETHRRALGTRARERASALSWTTAADVTMHALRTAAA